jgi:hypothetical protein
VIGADLETEMAGLRGQLARLKSENARLLRLLDLTPAQARPPGPTQTGIFDGPPAMVDASSPQGRRLPFVSMFAARSDVYAVRWENARTGRSGWMPAIRGGWRKGVAADSREYLALTEDILAVAVGVAGRGFGGPGWGVLGGCGGSLRVQRQQC